MLNVEDHVENKMIRRWTSIMAIVLCLCCTMPFILILRPFYNRWVRSGKPVFWAPDLIIDALAEDPSNIMSHDELIELHQNVHKPHLKNQKSDLIKGIDVHYAKFKPIPNNNNINNNIHPLIDDNLLDNGDVTNDQL